MRSKDIVVRGERAGRPPGMSRVKYFRLWLAYYMIHTAYHIMPPGRVKSQFWHLVFEWDEHIQKDLERQNRQQTKV